MAEIFAGMVSITPDGSNDATFSIDGNTGDMILGAANGRDGDLLMRDGAGKITVSVDANTPQILLRKGTGEEVALIGEGANIRLGGAGNDGDVLLFPRGAPGLRDDAKATIHLDGEGHQIILRDERGHEMGRIGDFANLRLGSGGHDGDILLFPSGARTINEDAAATIHLDANAGDITLRNADCAEEFEIAPSVAAEPGTVMALGPDGRLRPSLQSHEKAVVGVVSGAGGYRPGIVLDRQPGQGTRRSIALLGKAFVRVTDEAGPIEIGDLLTASSTPGVAMKATDPFRAFGAVIGKAIRSHDKGEGMIPMVIALQ